MPLSCLLLTMTLLAQTPAGGAAGAQPERPLRRSAPAAQIEAEAEEAATAGGAATASEAAEGPQRVPPASDQATPPTTARTTPPQLLEEALNSPVTGAIDGTPTSLEVALDRAAGRQLEATQLYWRLCVAVAEYNFARDEQALLGQFEADASTPAPNADPFEVELAAAAARSREAELAALEAQHALAALLGHSTTDALPVPSDRPHVGAYRTHFQEIFAQRSAPPRVRLIDRTLPLRRKAVDLRCQSVVAARDALEATLDAYGQQTTMEHVLVRIKTLARERRAFLQAVRDYNADIADYALAVAGVGASSRDLVAMLIKPPPAPPRSGTLGVTRGQSDDLTYGEEAAAEQDPPSAAAEQPTSANEPTPAPPEPQGGPTDEDAADDEPAPAPDAADASSPPSGATAVSAVRAAPSILSDVHPQRTLLTTFQSPAESAAATATTTKKLDTSGWRSASGGTRRAARPFDDEEGMWIARYQDPASLPDLSAGGVYSALLTMPPTKQAHHLAAALHAVPALPGDGEAIDLAAYLGAAPGDRRLLLAAYWTAREQTARYHVLEEQMQQLAALMPVALSARQTPEGAQAMLDLRVERLAAEAALVDAESALLALQMELTRLAARSLDGAWLVPSTTPHAGRYELNPTSGSPSRAVLAAQAEVPARHSALQDRARAVVLADASRTQVAGEYQAGLADDADETTAPRPLQAVLDAVAMQTEVSMDFLATLTRYNQGIADYVLATQPAGTSSEALVAMLVVRK